MATNSTPYLEVTQLYKHYGEGEAKVAVLRDISTRIEKRQICVLLGPSGSGKSTFLNLIGGLEPADSGTITVNGTELTALNAKQLSEYRRTELGFVFQFYNLVPDLTIRENIEVCQYLSSTPPTHRRFAAFAGALGTPHEIPAPGFRRPAATLRHRPCAGEEPRPFAVR